MYLFFGCPSFLEEENCTKVLYNVIECNFEAFILWYYKRPKTYFVKSKLLLVFLFFFFWKRTIDQKCFTTSSNVILKHLYYDITKDPRHILWNRSCYWFFCSSFFGRGQLIKSALQRYQILNEGNLKWRYFYWSIHDTMLKNINKKISCEIEAVDNLFQPLMNHLFNPTTLH